MRKLIYVLATTAVLGLGACNTVRGMGQDVSAAGNAVACTAEEIKAGKSGCSQ